MTSMFDQAVFLKFLAALLALLKPLYGIPIFLGMTQGFSPAERNRTALITSFAITMTALISLLVGEEILALFGIDVPSFRIAGGLIILGIAFAMLRAEDRRRAMPGRSRWQQSRAGATSRSCPWPFP